jgi:hypothetical protein
MPSGIQKANITLIFPIDDEVQPGRSQEASVSWVNRTPIRTMILSLRSFLYRLSHVMCIAQ